MTKIIITILVFVVLYILEAYHDYYVILNQNNNKEYDRKWHIYDFAFHVLCAGLVAYILGQWLIVPIAALIRWTVFQNGLNLLRGKDFFYLGASGMDAQIAKLGKNAGKILFVSCLILLSLLIYFLLKNL